MKHYHKTSLAIIIILFIFGVCTYLNVIVIQHSSDGGLSLQLMTEQVTDKRLENIKLLSNGYIIDNELYYSPEMKLVVYGLLDGLHYDGKGFSVCKECGYDISLLPQTGMPYTPSSYIEKLIKDSGGSLNACKIVKVSSNNTGAKYVISTKNDITLSSDEIYAKAKGLHEGQTFKTKKDYEDFCKNNPECNYDEATVEATMAGSLCSSYVNHPVFKGESYLLFRMDGDEISTNKDTANILFVNSVGGNGGMSAIQSVQLVD